MRIILLLVCCFILSNQAHACFVARADHFSAPLDLIERTDSIFLAKAIKAEKIVRTPPPDIKNYSLFERIFLGKSNFKKSGYDVPAKMPEMTMAPGEKNYTVNYTLNILEVIKGEHLENISLKGYDLQEKRHLDFDKHTKEIFWEDPSVGRTYSWPDCQVHYGFQVGETYLIFNSEPYHHKGFELIKDIDKDKWLAYVREKVKEQQGNE